MIDSILSHARWLVSVDTTNPPRKPAGLVARLAATLAEGGLSVSIADHGDGCVSIFARRGKADVLFNAHVDTVPVAPGWTREPFALSIEGDRAYGLGACDVKGGAAAMIAAAFATKAPCALLFTTDEEAGSATCMRKFISEKRAFRFAVVAEPTRARAVLAHRGVATGVMTFEGRAGHSSVARDDTPQSPTPTARAGTAGAETPDADTAGGAGSDARARAMPEADAVGGAGSALRARVGVGEGAPNPRATRSAVHSLLAWGAEAMRLAAELEAVERDGLRGVRFNIGRVEGGEKPNMIAARAEARFGVRPPPDMRGADVLARFAALAPGARFEARFEGPALVAGEAAAREVARLRLEVGPAVDFWTEASLLVEGGTPAIVLGPGDIAQAHGADEFVTLAELDAAARAYLSILEAA